MTKKNKILPITFIGMSGSGKTYWAEELGKKGFASIHCDDLIEEKLAPELQKYGFSGLSGVANWMGQPYQSGYQKKAAKYLSAETASMQQIISMLDTSEFSADKLVIDTTGSVIYTGDKIGQRLKKLTTVVYLYTPQHILDQMYQQYLKDPKPVIWGDLFQKLPQETDKQALARCYPLLLKYRAKKYQQYADITLDSSQLKQLDFTVEDLLNEIL